MNINLFDKSVSFVVHCFDYIVFLFSRMGISARNVQQKVTL